MRLLEAKRVGMPKKLYNANHWILTWLDLRILLTFKKQECHAELGSASRFLQRVRF